MKALVLFLLVILSALSTADTKDEIKRAYYRSTEASKLKYLDGVYCIRAPGFQLFNEEGMRLDLNVERARWEALIIPAVSVDEKVDIKSYSQNSVDRVLCNVVYTAVLLQVDPLTDKEFSQTLVTTCQDEWVLIKNQWLLRTTRVIHQEFKQ